MLYLADVNQIIQALQWTQHNVVIPHGQVALLSLIGFIPGVFPGRALVVAAHLLRYFSTMQFCGVPTVAGEYECETRTWSGVMMMANL